MNVETARENFRRNLNELLSGSDYSQKELALELEEKGYDWLKNEEAI